MHRAFFAAVAVALFCAGAFADYVTDGLLLRYDGIDNGGVDVHSDASTVWKDLSGNGYDLTLPAGAVVGGNEIWFPSNVTATVEGIAALADEGGSNFTVEVVGYVDGDWTPLRKGRWDHGKYTVVTTSLLRFFFLHPHGEPLSFYNYHGTAFGATYTTYRASNADWVRAWLSMPISHREWNSVGFVKRPHTYSFRHSSSKYEVAVDGGSAYDGQGSRICDTGFSSLDSNLTLGATEVGFHFRALRIYTRHLTVEEMRRNAAEDARRFPAFDDAVPQCAKSVFSDALYWFNGARAGEFNCYTSMPDVVRAGFGRHMVGDEVSYYDKSPKTDVSVEEMDVVCPYAQKVQSGQRAIRFRQPSWYDEAAETDKVNCTVLLNYIAGAFTNRSSYTVLARCKVESFVGPCATLFRLNYGWSAERGMWMQLYSDGHVRVLNGTTSIDYRKMQNYAATSFTTNQWLDIAVTSSGGTNILYMCREGGTFFSQKGTIKPVATKIASDYRFYFGGSNELTGTRDVDNSQPFRGWISQLAVWGRELSETEVRAAFSGGCGDGDAFRVGVPTGDAGEFGGTATSVDLADQDAWLTMTNRLDAKDCRLSFTFSIPKGRINQARTLAVTATGASAPSGAVDVTLNGTAIADGLSLAPGATATVAAPGSLFLADGNVLEIVRSDGGAGAIEFDAFSLSADAQETETVDAQRSDDDVFSSAAYWFVRPVDTDSSGVVFDLLCSTLHSWKFRSVLQAAIPAHTNHLWRRWNGPDWDYYGTVMSNPTNYPIERMSVKCPLSGLDLEDEPCVRFITRTEYVDDVPKSYYAGISRYIFPVTNNVGHSGVMRLRLDSFMLPTNRSCVVVSPGYNWGNNNGLSLHLYADDGSDDIYVRINAGLSGIPVREMLDYPEKDRIKVGKWMDLAYVMSNGWVRVYTCTEGGSLKVFGPRKWGDYSNYAQYPPDAERSYCYLGGGTATSGDTSSFTGFNGVFHSLALWPRPLSDEEVRAAMTWPRPDLVRIGVVNSSAAELPGGPNGAAIPPSGDFTGAPASILAADPYEISFSVSADDAKRNQRLTLYTLAGEPDCEAEVFLNSRKVYSYAESGDRIDSLTVASGGKGTFGIHNSFLREGENVLSIRRVDGGTRPVGLDALVLGNGGKHVRVISRMGLTVTVQ